MAFILAFKKEMTQQFGNDGSVAPVTFLQAKPCTVTQIKNKEHDGYDAVQIGVGARKKPLKSVQSKPFRVLREFRVSGEELKNFSLGQIIEVGAFKTGGKVTVISISKGHGFSGVVKRHKFAGHPSGHGHKDSARAPGSIGQAGVQHVFKGVRMAGRMGNERVTVKNLEVIEVLPDKSLLVLKGSMAGPRGALVLVRSV